VNRAAVNKSDSVPVASLDEYAEGTGVAHKERVAAVSKPTIVNPSSLAGKTVPERRWLVPHWIPMGVVTLLYGDGGVGKSLIAQQLQTSTALGRNWLGLHAEKVASLGVYCEDDRDELWRRQVAFNTHYGCTMQNIAASHWMPRMEDDDDNRLMSFTRSGVGELTKFHADVMEAALDLRVGLTIIDTVTDTFGGNEIDRSQVRLFVGQALARLSQLGRQAAKKGSKISVGRGKVGTTERAVAGARVAAWR
jgi:hypothetical protein